MGHLSSSSTAILRRRNVELIFSSYIIDYHNLVSPSLYFRLLEISCLSVCCESTCFWLFCSETSFFETLCFGSSSVSPSGLVCTSTSPVEIDEVDSGDVHGNEVEGDDDDDDDEEAGADDVAPANVVGPIPDGDECPFKDLRKGQFLNCAKSIDWKCLGFVFAAGSPDEPSPDEPSLDEPPPDDQ